LLLFFFALPASQASSIEYLKGKQKLFAWLVFIFILVLAKLTLMMIIGSK